MTVVTWRRSEGHSKDCVEAKTREIGDAETQYAEVHTGALRSRSPVAGWLLMDRLLLRDSASAFVPGPSLIYDMCCTTGAAAYIISSLRRSVLPGSLQVFHLKYATSQPSSPAVQHSPIIASRTFLLYPPFCTCYFKEFENIIF